MKNHVSTLQKKQNSPQTFILIPGAWLSGWFWKPVKERLEAEGHRVLAVDLPGHGNNNTPLNNQNLESYARYVATILDQESNQVILVGHSLGGAISCQAAEYNPTKIKKLVVLCGFLLNDGESVNGLRDGINPRNWLKMAESGLVTLSPDNKISYWNPQTVPKTLCGNMNKEAAKKVIQHLGGEAIAAQYQTANLGKNFACVPKIYIKTLRDNMLSLELQDKMIQRVVEKVYTLDSDHFPFLSVPQDLSDILGNIATVVV